MHNSIFNSRLSLLLILVCQLFAFNTFANEHTKTIELDSGEEITGTVYGQNNNVKILWFSPSYGFHKRHLKAARNLAEAGMETWQVSLPESLFMPKGAETMRNIPAEIVANLIEKFSEHGKYQVLMLSSGYGSIPTLRGVRAWQNRKKKQAKLSGVILFSPYFYTSVPSLGNAPDMVSVISATNIPLYIFQAEKNGNRMFAPAMIEQLQLHAPVYTEITKGVTSIFYREDTAPETLALLDNFAVKIKFAAKQLSRHEIPAEAIPLKKAETIATSSGLNAELKPYKGSVKPATINLVDVHNNHVSINNYKGKVTLVNFWATWCTPCIEEIPSLNRLKEKMKGKPFQLISVNYAEPAKQIKEFMKKVSVDFPVLIDPQGKTSAKWKVVAFPSTFVIGPDGEIHYGVNAAIHWDTDRVVQQIEQLIKQ